jgi:hypothetical protein
LLITKDSAVGFSLYVHRFVRGESVPMDEASIQRILRPYVVVGEGASLLIRASDGGEVDVHADASGISIHRPVRGGVFDVVAELLDGLDAVLIAPGCPAILRSEADREHLPGDFQRDAIVVELTGSALEQALLSS